MIRLPKLLTAPLHIARGGGYFGLCRLCGGERPARTFFFARRTAWPDNWREALACIRCHGIARWRAVAAVLDRVKPDWRQGRLHEAAPAGAISRYLRRSCTDYVGSHWFGERVAPGARGPDGRHVNEDLERQTFADAAFDVVVTQDVLEHVFEPERALREITRTLRPGGVHVWTVPRHDDRPTRRRARRHDDGSVEHLLEPEYHDNPIDPQGSLVVTDWGSDTADLVTRWTGLATRAFAVEDRGEGILQRPDGGTIEVLVSG
jgi:SAM-dependent methyltransferase